MQSMAVLLLVVALPGAALAGVPFVGCKSDGQAGLQEAPARPSSVISVTAGAASDLAEYASAQMAVLAPRGWYCFGYYGSSGSFLLVSPDPATGTDQLLKLPAFTGPAVQIGFSYEGTSGRFAVAEIAARLFPSERAFVDAVNAEKMAPKISFGPYPTDRLESRGADDVAYVTPGGVQGIGTHSHLAAGPLPIEGEAIYVHQGDGGVIKADVRLPLEQRDLAAEILGGMRQGVSAP